MKFSFLFPYHLQVRKKQETRLKLTRGVLFLGNVRLR